jgi:phage terminase large subunit GpA-like protein
VDSEWCQQFGGEQLVTVRTRRGFSRLEWQKLRERNEALDCRVYARTRRLDHRCRPLAGIDLARLRGAVRQERRCPGADDACHGHRAACRGHGAIDLSVQPSETALPKPAAADDKADSPEPLDGVMSTVSAKLMDFAGMQSA